jgi:hypothetical protein
MTDTNTPDTSPADALDISDHDLQVSITLCSLTYLDEDDSKPDQQRDLITQYLAFDDLPMGGRWTLAWGPASFDENMWYIAENTDTGVFALVIRGTVMTSFFAKLGDIDIVPVRPGIKDAPPDATIARGIAVAHAKLNYARDPWTGLTAWEFLAQEIARRPTGGIDVIGHSLGGALAPVIALDAMQRFPHQPVRSFAWAGMSPGNEAFKDWYMQSLHQQKLQTHSRFISSLDIIPQWYADLETMKRGFPGGPVPPPPVEIGIDAMELVMRLGGITYVATPNPKKIPAMVYRNLSLWADQAHAQHEHRYYMFLTGISEAVITLRFPPDPGQKPWLPPTSPASPVAGST